MGKYSSKCRKKNKKKSGKTLKCIIKLRTSYETIHQKIMVN